MAERRPNRYAAIIVEIFSSKYRKGSKSVAFDRDDIIAAAERLGLPRPKNVGDVLYSFKHRVELPSAITQTAPKGTHWIIRHAGTAKYRFELSTRVHLLPNADYVVTKVPDATPGLISMYALDDEQALLAIIRYNRIIDLLTGLTCYSLQNHLRTSVKDIGQIEVDELYVGIARDGAHYVLPVQAKGGRDRINLVQLEQDAALCAARFPNLVCRPIAAQFMAENRIALFDMVVQNGVVKLHAEKHYQLVSPSEMDLEELREYKRLAMLH